MVATSLMQRQVSVKVGGDASNLMTALANGRGALSTTAKVVGGLSIALGVVVGIMGGKAVKAASSWEDQLVEINKVTDPETARELDESLRDLGITLRGISTRELGEDDHAAEPAIEEAWRLMGGLVAIFDQLDDVPDRVDVITLPADTETFEKALRWHLTADWARTYRNGEASKRDLAARVDETFEVVDVEQHVREVGNAG